jgi:hypothetical protein
MQTIPMSWIIATCTLTPSPAHLHVLSEARSGTPQRCQQCDIPLGSQPCPNPQCQETHGQRAGALCVWCRDHQQEYLERGDLAG